MNNGGIHVNQVRFGTYNFGSSTDCLPIQIYNGAGAGYDTMAFYIKKANNRWSMNLDNEFRLTNSRN